MEEAIYFRISTIGSGYDGPQTYREYPVSQLEGNFLYVAGCGCCQGCYEQLIGRLVGQFSGIKENILKLRTPYGIEEIPGTLSNGILDFEHLEVELLGTEDEARKIIDSVEHGREVYIANSLKKLLMNSNS